MAIVALITGGFVLTAVIYLSWRLIADRRTRSVAAAPAAAHQA